MRRCAISLLLFILGIPAALSINNKDNRPSIAFTKKSNLVRDGIVNINALNDHLASLEYKYGNSPVGFAVKRQTGSVPLEDVDSDFWYGPITVGGQNFTVVFDTGTSDFFLPGPDCGISCSGHKIYNTSSATDTGNTFQISSNSGSTISGKVYTDSVTVAGLTVKTQSLGVGNKYSSSFSSFIFLKSRADGVMGLAYPDIAKITNTPPFFNNLIQGKSVSSGAFGLKLAKSGSVFYLGGVDPSSSSGPFNTLPVTQKGYWQVKLDSINVGGSAILSSLSAIINTGTPFVVGPPKAVSQFYEAIPGARSVRVRGKDYFIYPCNPSPNISMTFGGSSYDITSTFNMGSYSARYCYGGMFGLALKSMPDAWLVGGVFLSNVYAEFSFDNNTVGFSKQA